MEKYQKFSLKYRSLNKLRITVKKNLKLSNVFNENECLNILLL